MDQLEFDGQTYVSSKRAAGITGYAKDYVGQLCREGRVQARLVGRNWYVLESSIREHRFGPPQPESTAKDEQGNWNSPQYKAETPSSIPTIETKTNISYPYAPERLPEAPVDHSKTIEDMQNAWQDWFRERNMTSLDEDLLESPQVVEEREEKREEVQTQMHEVVRREPEETVHVVRMVQEPVPEVAKEPVKQEQEEIVPIHRSYYVPTPVVEPVPVARTYEPIYTPQEPVYAPTRSQARIINERRVTKKKKPSVALQAFFLSLAGIAIAAAVIGTGHISGLLGQGSSQYAPINFLGGVDVVNTGNK